MAQVSSQWPYNLIGKIRVTTNELLEMRPNFLHIMHQDTWNLVVWPALDRYSALSLDGAHIGSLLDLLSRKRDHVSRNVVHEIFNEFFVTDWHKVNFMPRVLYFLELMKYLLPMVIVLIITCLMACFFGSYLAIYIIALARAEELSNSEGLGFPMVIFLSNKNSINPR